MAIRKKFHYYTTLEQIVPESNERYLISLKEENGVYHPYMKDRYTGGSFKRLEDGETRVTLFGKRVSVPTHWLVMFTWSPLYDSRRFAFELEVMFTNKGEPLNYHPSNLFWVIPEGGVEDPDKRGYNIIPTHSRVSISQTGIAWNRKTHRELSSRKATNKKKNTYINFDFFNNINQIDTIGQHKAVAMAWLRVEKNPFSLTVNHKAGSKKRNHVSELEWMTYSENNIHAKETGLNKVREEFIAYDYMIGRAYRFKSVSECAYWFGVNTGSIHSMAVTTGIYQTRYQFAYRRDLERDRVKLKFLDKELIIDDVPIINVAEVKICAYHKSSNKLILADNQYTLAHAIGYLPRDVLYRLWTKRRYFDQGNYLIAYKREMDAIMNLRNRYPVIFDKKGCVISRETVAIINNDKRVKFKSLRVLANYNKIPEDEIFEFEKQLVLTGVYSDGKRKVELIREKDRGTVVVIR